MPQPDLAAQVAHRAFDAVGDAISSRDYEPFIAMSADDGRFRIFSVLDEYRGRELTKAQAVTYHRREGEDWRFRAVVTRGRVLRDGDSSAFEFSHDGHAIVGPYGDQLVLVLDVEGDRIATYREYAAGIDPRRIAKLQDL